MGCANLVSVTFNNELTEIPSQCFYRCTSLKSIVWPASLKELGAYSFAGCGALESVMLPNGVETLGECCFFNNRMLNSIWIPNTISLIDKRCFQDCIKLKMTHVSNPTPITISDDVFEGIDVSNATLYIPQGSSYLYGQSPVWSAFGHILEE